MPDPWDTPEGQTHYVDDGCPGGHREGFDYRTLRFGYPEEAAMIQTPEFDFHASIKRLVKAERGCLKCNSTGNTPETAYPSGVAVSTCSGCGGTGRIVPFASLRVPCAGEFLASDKPKQCRVVTWQQINSVGKLMTRYWGQPLEEHIAGCGGGCLGRGWVPEPDVEKACWRVLWRLPYHVRRRIIYDGNGLAWEEAALRAAEAWVWAEEENDA